MKIKAFNILLVGLLLLGCVLAGCLKYKDIPACTLQAGFTVQGDVITCPDATCEVLFIDSSDVLPDLVYEWDFQDNSDKEIKRSPGTTHRFVPNNSKPYRVLLTVRLGEGCMDTFSRDIWVLDGGPMAKFTTDKAMNMCFANETVTFANESEDATRYEWDFGDMTTKLPVTNKDPVTHMYTKSGTYPVVLTAFNDVGRTGVTTVEVVVKAKSFTRSYSFGNVSCSTGAKETIVGVAQSDNGGYYAAISTSTGCYFLKIDADGKSLNEPLIKIPPESFNQVNIYNFKKVSDGFLLVGEGVNTSTGATRMHVYKTNLNFDFQDRSNLGNPGEPGIDAAFDVTETDTKHYLICGFALQRPDSNGIYLMNTNTGNNVSERWHKYIFSNEKGSSATAILNYAGGYLVAGQKLNGGSLEACFFKLSDTFEPSGIQFLGPGFFPSDILPLGNDRFIISGNVGGTAQTVIVNITTNQTTPQKYSGWTLGELALTNEGRLVGTGTLNNRAGWFEINPATGEMLSNSQSYLPADFTRTEGISITPTADGGFLIGGTGCKTNGSACSLLFKTDANGKN